jgi:hypothetical protein
VQVADLAITEFGDHLLAIVDPPGILQVTELRVANRRDRHFPGAVLRRLVVEQEVELRAGREREELPVVLATLQIVAVDRDDEVTRLDLLVVVIGRPVLVDVADLEVTGRVGDEIEARVARLLRSLDGAWAAADACV